MNNQNILLLIGSVIIIYLLFNREKFENNPCIKTDGTACESGNRRHRCEHKCCKCACGTTC